MANQDWNAAFDTLGGKEHVDRDEPSKGLNVLKHGERHAEIVREKLLKVFGTKASPLLNRMEIARRELGNEIDGFIDAIVKNAQKDGLDLDSEVLDKLIVVNAKAYAIQLELREIHQLLTPEK